MQIVNVNAHELVTLAYYLATVGGFLAFVKILRGRGK